MSRLWLVCLVLFASAAAAQPDPFAEEEDAGPFEVGGNVKTFATGLFPYEHTLLPDDPVIGGLAAGRVTATVKSLEIIDAEVHGLLAAIPGGSGGFGGFVQSGVFVQRPEAIDLSLDLAESELGRLSFVVDRAAVAAHLPHLDVTLGRQPITFGSAYFFTPMDLVAPFSPATIDREYKPGIDALRVDVYLGTATQITAVAAYADEWSTDGMTFASHARTNVAGSDIGVFVAEHRGDLVTGLDLATDAFGVGLRGEATATFPENGTDDAFLRAVAGADVLLPANATLMGEVYLQTLGTDDPAEYLQIAAGERFARGELWLSGRLYAAAALSWELNPLLRPGASAIVNLEDGSVLASPTLSWSVSDEVNLALGAQLTLGERPADVQPSDLVRPDGTPKSEAELGALLVPKSEFGLYPNVVFLQMSAYF